MRLLPLLPALPALLAAVTARAEPKPYRPGPGPHETAAVARMSLEDELRGKDVVFRVTYPKTTGKAPVIVWSHGMYGSKDAYGPLARFWASHGYVVVQPTHEDSIKRGLKSKAEASRAWRSRPADVSFLIESLEKIGKTLPVAPDAERIGAGGHSFGAHTSMLLAGAKVYGLSRKPTTLSDKRPKCFLLVSPQGVGGLLREDSWSDMKRPALVVTGSKDGDPFGDPEKTPQWRLAPFEKSAPGDKHLVFIEGAGHSFGGIAGIRRRRTRKERNEHHVNVVRFAGLAFFDAYVKGDARARRWLDEGAVAEATKAEVETKKR